MSDTQTENLTMPPDKLTDDEAKTLAKLAKVEQMVWTMWRQHPDRLTAPNHAEFWFKKGARQAIRMILGQ